jgi:hypothetical protein
LQKPWLLQVARRVDRRSKVYQQQLETCRDQLEGFRWHRVVWALLLLCLAMVWLSWMGFRPWKRSWSWRARHRGIKRKTRQRRS